MDDKENTGLSLFAGTVHCPTVEPSVVELMSGRVKGRTLPAIATKLDRVFITTISAVEGPVKYYIDRVGVHLALDLCLFVFGHSVVDSLDRLTKRRIYLFEELMDK